MKIEVGKFYKMRDERKVRIYCTDGDARSGVHGAFYNGRGWFAWTWTKEGISDSSTGKSNYDIISEWVEPHPAESWPVDAKILVRDYEGGEWVKRYFAKFENGIVHSWAGGDTSWSSSGQTTVWKLAKLAGEA